MRLAQLAILGILALPAWCPGTALADDLARRADLGTAIAPPSDGKPPRVVRFRAGSVLEGAGLKVGDELAAIGTSRAPRIPGDPAADGNAFGAFVRAARGGDTLKLRVRRGSETLDVQVVLPAMRRESVDGVDVVYGSVVTPRGYRVRTYISRPKGAVGRLPLVVFIPWLSCGPVENPLGVRDGWSMMIHTVMREGGAQVVRIEKPGVGDSEGPDCSEADLDHDMDAFRAGIRAALRDPGADPQRLYLFGGSVGGALAPILVRDHDVRGLIVTGGFTQTWLEHMLDIERRRLVLSGQAPAAVNAAMRAFGGFYDRVLNRGDTPAQALAAHPEWKPYWYDGPAHQYGRPIRYYQQLQRLDVEDAWQRVAVPTLVVWGEYDWIMGRAESDRAVAILATRDPKLATYEIRPRMNHHFDAFPDALAAFKEEGGKYDAGAAEAMVRWLRSR